MNLPHFSAGLDARCEYVFKDVEPQMKPPQSEYNEELIKTPNANLKQTVITDTFRERKRKNTDKDIAQSKEKKKRESAFLDSFKTLKESFGKTSKVLKEDLEKTTVMSEKLLRELTHLEQPGTSKFPSANLTTEQNYDNNQQLPVKSTFEEPNPYEINDDDFNDEFIDEDKINNILNEIESEISKENSKPEVSNKTKLYRSNANELQKAAISRPVSTEYIPSRHTYTIENSKKDTKQPVSKNIPKKTNFSFIDLLEKNVDLSDEEEIKIREQNSFSDTIRCHIDKYLQKAKTTINVPDIILTGLKEDEPLTSKETEPTFSVQDSSRNKDDYNAKLYETMQHNYKDSNNEKPTTDIDEIYEENELPAIILSKNNNRYDIDTENVVEKRESRIIPEYNNIHNTSSNKNIQQENEPMKVITESKTTENIGIYKLNEEPDLKELKPVLGNETEALVLLIGPNKKDLAVDNASTATAVNKCPIVLPSSYAPETKENQEHEIEQPRRLEPKQVEIEPGNNENIEMEAYNNPTSIALGIHKVSRQLNSDKNSTPIALPKPISHLPKLIEKPESPMMEMWKNSIKDLSILEFGEINNEVATSSNTMSYAYDKPQAFTQKNYKTNRLPVDLQKIIGHVPKVTENLSAIELPKNNKGVSIPSPKYHKTGVAVNMIPSTQTSNNKNSAFPSTLDIKENERCLEIEQPKNNKEIREITKCNAQASAFDNQLVFTQKRFNCKLPSTHYHNPETKEIQSILQKEPPRSNAKENSEIATFSFTSSQPNYTQHNYNYKLPFVLSNTVSRVPELQEKQQLSVMELRKNTIQGIKDMTLYNNCISFDFGNQADLQNCNNDKIVLPNTASRTPEFNEKQRQRIELKSPTNKDVSTYKNCASSLQNHDYNYSNADNRTQYINKYSFSTNKTDVSTQETTDHVVRVIKNMRINFDVTEIVSKEKKIGRDEREQIDNKAENPVAFKKRKHASSPNIEYCTEKLNTKIVNYSSEFGNNNGTDKPKALQISDNLTAVQKFSEKQCLLALPAYTTTPATRLLSSTPTLEFMEENIQFKEVDKDNGVKNRFSENEIADSAVEKKPTSVESILQKFRNNTG